MLLAFFFFSRLSTCESILNSSNDKTWLSSGNSRRIFLVRRPKNLKSSSVLFDNGFQLTRKWYLEYTQSQVFNGKIQCVESELRLFLYNIKRLY